MIQFKNIHKSFNKQQVLRGVDFEIPKGEITVILGQSGQGKSVLLKILMGLLEPDKGTILIDGKIYGDNDCQNDK